MIICVHNILLLYCYRGRRRYNPNNKQITTASTPLNIVLYLFNIISFYYKLLQSSCDSFKKKDGRGMSDFFLTFLVNPSREVYLSRPTVLMHIVPLVGRYIVFFVAR